MERRRRVQRERKRERERERERVHLTLPHQPNGYGKTDSLVLSLIIALQATLAVAFVAKKEWLMGVINPPPDARDALENHLVVTGYALAGVAAVELMCVLLAYCVRGSLIEEEADEARYRALDE